ASEHSLLSPHRMRPRRSEAGRGHLLSSAPWLLKDVLRGIIRNARSGGGRSAGAAPHGAGDVPLDELALPLLMFAVRTAAAAALNGLADPGAPPRPDSHEVDFGATAHRVPLEAGV